MNAALFCIKFQELWVMFVEKVATNSHKFLVHATPYEFWACGESGPDIVQRCPQQENSPCPMHPTQWKYSIKGFTCRTCRRQDMANKYAAEIKAAIVTFLKHGQHAACCEWISCSIHTCSIRHYTDFVQGRSEGKVYFMSGPTYSDICALTFSFSG